MVSSILEVARVFDGSAGKIAPIGSYVEWEGQIMNTQVYDNVVEQKVASFNRFIFGIEIGRQRVLYDFILLDYGLRAGIVVSDLLMLIGDGYKDVPFETEAGQGF